MTSQASSHSILRGSALRRLTPALLPLCCARRRQRARMSAVRSTYFLSERRTRQLLAIRAIHPQLFSVIPTCMTTHIARLIMKMRPTGTLDIPPSAWSDLARELGARFNAEICVHRYPKESAGDDRPERPPYYLLDVSILGDARSEVLAVIDYMEPAIDALIAKYTQVPSAR